VEYAGLVLAGMRCKIMRVKMVLFVCACLIAGGLAETEARRAKDHKPKHVTAAAAAAVPALPDIPRKPTGSVGFMHWLCVIACVGVLLACIRWSGLENKALAFRRCSSGIAIIFMLEACAHALAPMPHASVSIMILLSVLFTISPVEDPSRPIGLHMGTVPALCVLWLGATRVMLYDDFVRAIYGSDTLRPYHLIVMFLGSVYLCTALERSGFLHTAALRVVEKYGRSPWGLFWALGIFSGTLTVLIPDDIVTMTLTPITIRMCQLLNLPEIPYLFSQFFAGNIWAVTLVTGNPTNVLLAEDLGDSFVSFAKRMGIPGIAAGLTSFVLMYVTNRDKINSVSSDTSSGSGSTHEGLLHGSCSDSSSDDPTTTPRSVAHGATEATLGHQEPSRSFTKHGVFCLLRVLTATLTCALESVHGLPVYLVVLIMGVLSFVYDACASLDNAVDVLRHMPWELFSFVAGFLILAEAMSITGISLWLATIFLGSVTSRNVAYISGFTTMLFCNTFETLPATLIVFKMIDSVPAWQQKAIMASGAMKPMFQDARRAALSAVIFGSNFGANTACIGSLGGLMMRRLALQQGVEVTNYMLLKQGIPVMIPTMLVACWVLIHQESI